MRFHSESGVRTTVIPQRFTSFFGSLEIARRQAAEPCHEGYGSRYSCTASRTNDTPRFESYTSSLNSSTNRAGQSRAGSQLLRIFYILDFGLLIHSALLRTGFWIYVKMKAAA